ncbi:MAG: alkaline phosphatase [Clostridia bacterium]|jgi:alkaline phosphatase|nr:alkaline phosphatase [Clostridia bacterium]MBT7122000.1 alkaline phosphatase [Clostridia bacterium]
MLRKSIVTLLVIAIFMLCACAPVALQAAQSDPTPSPSQSIVVNTATPTASPIETTAPAQQEPYPKYIFIFIGDGMGVNQKTISQSFLQYISGDDTATLQLNSMNVNASVSTYSANADITDSAASATALATGVKTNNAMISVTPDETELRTLLEAVQDIGYATGIVTTTRITHATPACFYAHNTHRSNESEIALELLNSDIDFIAGGGLKFFLPLTLPEPYASFAPDVRNFEIVSTRTDERNLVDEFADKGYEIYLGPDGSTQLMAYSPAAGDKVFAPLTYNYFPYEIDRLNRFGALPSLSDLTQKAIDLLSLDDDGFFLMVEGGRIDYAGHNNDVMSIIYDTLAFDDAVQTAIAFYLAHPEDTLIITTSDHETGGLTLDADIDYLTLFDGVYDISASYGDGYGMLYEPRIGISEYVDALNAMGIINLTDGERSKLRRALRADEEIEYKDDYIDTLTSLAVNAIINARLGVSWSTDYHTGVNVDLGVTGIFEERFADAVDNTDIANILADILDVDIGP